MLVLPAIVGQTTDVVEDVNWWDRLDEIVLPTWARILLILVVAVTLTWLLSRVMRRAVHRTLHFVGRQLPVDRARAEARERAISTALRSGLIGVIWAAAVITIIGELGFNIGGVIASAAIIGGAIAFGAQALVRDVIAGLFVLIEDQYGLGDEVDLGIARGTVQRITLRHSRLSDAEGRVWFVPHGNVLRVANLSAASLAVIELEVDRAMPLARLDELAETLRARLWDDEVAHPLLAGEARIVGIGAIQADSVRYRLVAPTLPGRQGDVQRRWTVLAVDVFEEAGGGEDSVTAPLLRAVSSSTIDTAFN